MQKHRELTLERIGQFGRRLEKYIYVNPRPLKLSYFTTSEPVSFAELGRHRFKSIQVGEQWGKDFDCAWFKITGRVERSQRGKNLVAVIDLGGEACLFSPSGKPLQGLTPKFDDQHGGFIGPKKELKLYQQAKGTEKINLLLDAGANHLQGRQRQCSIKQADLCEFNEIAFKLFHEYRFLELLLKALPENNRQAQLLFRALNDVNNLVDDFSDSALKKARRRLQQELKHRAVDTALNVSAIGHAHLDVAWLWPLRETVRKCARTFSTALRMMDEYPDYHFGASQPHLYQMTKDNYPALYKDIKQAVAKGRWEVQGGMWVESDCNIPSGESLVRQVLYGKRFFQQEFGIDVDHLWLPDVFGYSGALPQILRKSGINYFTTHKLNWNQFNQFPHHTMYWQGIDGTKIFSHFMTGNDYNVPATPDAFMRFESENRDGDRTNHALCLFGIGDGGGGPGRTHIEWTRLARDLQSLPKVTMEKAADFFPKAEADAVDLLTWVGELYFEYHRGTYTTQALVKKMNRKLEFLIREVEIAYSQLPPKHYPGKDLERLWKVLLLNQFHDIIPGSSITRVYDEAHAQYQATNTELQNLLTIAQQQIARRIDTRSLNKPLILSNSLSWQREDLVLLPGARSEKWQSADGQALATQKVADGVLVSVPVSGLGYTLIQPDPKRRSLQNSQSTLKTNPWLLENKLIRVELNKSGGIKRIFDKQANREVLEGGKGNHFCLYEDLPLAYEAWDIDAYYLEKAPSHPVLISSTVVNEGPLKNSIEQVYEGENYRIVQSISVTRDNPMIEFDTQVDWQASQKMLRVNFPVNVHATDATYEIQFGHLKRPTHMNTSWDMARFESVAHKWADISQPNYGVALINDCKYGYSIQGNIMSMNLLRAPTRPDPEADRHQHQFRYALLPHAGNHIEAEVVQRAYEFNVPHQVFAGIDNHKPGRALKATFLNCDAKNLVVDSIKQAEDDSSTIVRLYESAGIDTSATIDLPASTAQVSYANLMEQSLRELPMNDRRQIKISVKPFEILTLKLQA